MAKKPTAKKTTARRRRKPKPSGLGARQDRHAAAMAAYAAKHTRAGRGE